MSDSYELTDIKEFPTLSEVKPLMQQGETQEDLRERMGELGKSSLFFLCKVILGYKDMNARVHGPMCNFSDQTLSYLRRLKLMPRTHFKTTVWTIGESIRDIITDPNIRILMIADTSRNAERFLQEVQQHFQFNEVFRWLYKDIIPENFNTVRWSTTEMIVNRSLIAREPTIDAIGALGGSESRHYNIIRADDLITEKAIRSDVEMDKIIDWAGGLESLLIDQHKDRIDYVGSRKKKGDLYEHVIKNYGFDEEPVDMGPYAHKMGDLAVFTRQAEEGDPPRPIFPEKISQKFLRRLRRTHPQRYHAQYANSPKGSGLNVFDESWIRYYNWNGQKVQLIHEGELVKEVSPYDYDRFLLFDPAVAEKQKNSMQAQIVLCIVDSYWVVLETRIGHYTPDEAVDNLFELQEKWALNFMSIERRGFQGWVKFWVDEKAEREGKPYLPILLWPPEGDPRAQWAKTEHIRGLQPYVRSNLLWIHEDMMELRDQLEFYPNVRHDDGLDCLAQGLTYAPAVEDATETRKNKDAELSYLESQMMGVNLDSFKETWDEEKFLAQFDATGYGFKLPRIRA